ncbi:gfo/Idh/MocA family oxidoreductase [Pseudactinotalea sp. HY160]|nr:gfo/Idh/MocA family oxidoreductase [Pseudactinotalea sp. HY160]
MSPSTAGMACRGHSRPVQRRRRACVRSRSGRPRVGLIGTGGISAAHIAGWQVLGSDLTLYSRSGARAAAERVGARAAATVGELIEGSDIVGILTPPATHREYALAALAAGRHVVCEKPLGRTVAEAIDIAAAAATSAGVLFPAHVVRYFPAYAEARARVAAGEIGEVLATRFLRAGTAPPAGAWFYDEAASGGIIMDQLVHDLDQARWFAGEVTEVYARRTTGTTGTASGSGEPPAPVHTAAVTLTHASGATSQVTGYWGPPGLEFTTGFDLHGTTAALRHSTLDARSLTLDPTGTGEAAYIPAGDPADSPFTAQLRDLLAAIDGAPARVEPFDGVVSVAIAQAALESVHTRGPVAVDERELRSAVHTR